MRAVVVTGPAAQDWQWKDLPDNHQERYEYIRRTIGGWLETLPALDSLGAIAYYDEEHSKKDYRPSALWYSGNHVYGVIKGSIVITGVLDVKGFETDLTPEALLRVKQRLRPVLPAPPSWFKRSE